MESQLEEREGGVKVGREGGNRRGGKESRQEGREGGNRRGGKESGQEGGGEVGTGGEGKGGDGRGGKESREEEEKRREGWREGEGRGKKGREGGRWRGEKTRMKRGNWKERRGKGREGKGKVASATGFLLKIRWGEERASQTFVIKLSTFGSWIWQYQFNQIAEWILHVHEHMTVLLHCHTNTQIVDSFKEGKLLEEWQKCSWQVRMQEGHWSEFAVHCG